MLGSDLSHFIPLVDATNWINCLNKVYPFMSHSEENLLVWVSPLQNVRLPIRVSLFASYQL